MSTPSLPYNQALGTYYQNNLRTDILKLESPLGYGVPMSPLVHYQIAPRYSGSDDIFAQQTPVANVPFAFNTSSPCYVAPTTTSPAYMQFDCLRCVVIAPVYPNSTVGIPTVITIVGTDDRGILVSEKLTSSGEESALDTGLVSNKAYYRILSITPSDTFGINTLVYSFPSNMYFGLPYYTNFPVLAFIWKQGTRDEPTLSGSFARGLPFRTIVPNDTATTYDFSTDPVKLNNPQADARGIIQFGQFPGETTVWPSYEVTLSVPLYVPGADSVVQALINRPLLNGNTLTQMAFQSSVSQMAVNPTNPLTTPTQLTQFDLFGAQYPGDKVAFNQTFQSLPNWQMA